MTIRRVREHLCTDKNSNIFKHLKSSDKCKKACNDSCFTILDSVSTYHQLKIKEALHILWERPVLKKQDQHFDVSLSFQSPYCLYNGCHSFVRLYIDILVLLILYSVLATDDG